MIEQMREERTRIRFRNPPIVEAIIGIMVAPLPSAVVEIIGSVEARMRDLGFTKCAPINSHEVQIRIENGQSSAQKNDELVGFRFISEDGSRVTQFTKTGFTFNRVGAYSSWEEFTSEAIPMWKEYLSIVGPVELVSFQVRYLNKLFIPFGEPFENYIRVFTFLPPDVPQEILESFFRIALPIASPPGKLTHVQVLLPPEREGHSTILFDNDFQFPAIQIPISRIWEHIENVRDVKDEYFLKFLTDKMKDTFNA